MDESIKHLKASGSFLKSFSAFRTIFSSEILDHAVQGVLLRIGNRKRAQEDPSEDRGLPQAGSELELRPYFRPKYASLRKVPTNTEVFLRGL